MKLPSLSDIKLSNISHFGLSNLSSLRLPIYMDNHATTPVDPRVLDKMLPFFNEHFGNAASRNHTFGWTAEQAVTTARKEIASLIGAKHREIIFTSGATESNNLALFGATEYYADKGNHVITQVTEHKAVLDTCEALERRGIEVSYLPVDRNGYIEPEAVKEAITDKTVLVSIMYANNEIGTVLPIAEIGKICHQAGVLFHTDASQGMSTLPFDVKEMNIDLASLSSHKMYGPKGIGALYIRRRAPRVRLAPLIYGGGHERGLRSGTLNVPCAVGFGEAARLVRQHREEDAREARSLRDQLQSKLAGQLEHIYLNGHPQNRLPGNLNISFAFVEADALMMAIKQVAVSSGSACTNEAIEPSYVLKAMGIDEELARSSIRFGIGRFNSKREVAYVAKKVVKNVNRLRDQNPLWRTMKDGGDPDAVAWTAQWLCPGSCAKEKWPSPQVAKN